MLAFCVGVWASPGRAQPPVDPVAAQLKQRGDAAMQAGDFREALDAYTKALSAEPSPALHYNRGRALQGLARNAGALEEFERFRDTAPAELKSAVPDLDGLIDFVRQQIAEVTVTSSVPGASVRVRNRAWPLPLSRPLRFDPSTIDVEVVADGYEPWRSRLTLTAGDRRELTAHLVRRDLRAVLRVKSPTAGAFVTVDGARIGSAPIELRVAPGEHSIEVSRPGYETASSRVVLREREQRSISVSLERSTRFYERWWFWTGAGVIAATGVVAVVALSTERPAAKGDIPPGQLTAPCVRF